MKTLTQLFNFVLDNYNNGQKLAGHSDPNYDVLVRDIPLILKLQYLLGRTDLLITGSCGQGQKTEYPWVCIFNTNVTRSAQNGIYIAILFKKDMSGFYLALNQGITYFASNYGRKKYECAQKVSEYFRNEINDKYFFRGSIDLGATNKGTLGYGYQVTTVLSKYYAKNNFTDKSLKDDLLRILSIYDEVVGVLEELNYNYNTAIDQILMDKDKAFVSATQAINDIKNAITSPIDVDVARKLLQVKRG